jgi:hypothetical protein
MRRTVLKFMLANLAIADDDIEMGGSAGEVLRRSLARK